MGSFANTLFSALLGWVQSAVSWLWKLIGSEDAGSLMGWVLDNWLMLVILLCAGGVLIDLVVYLLRWQPYRVWRSFWRQITGKDAAEEAAQIAEQEALLEAHQWVYADGSMTIEPAPEPELPQLQPQEPALAEQEEMQLKAPVRPARRVIPARRRRAADGSEEYLLPDLGGEQQAYHRPYYPPQWNTGEQKMIDEGENT